MEAVDRTEVIRRLGGLLFQNGYVKETYVQAVLDREVAFPTGLQTSTHGVAIPHTDTEHVIRPALAIATLAKPVIFQGMGMPETSIPVMIVIMLAVNDPQGIMPVLRSVLFILENGQAIEALANAKDQLEIKQIMQEHIRAMVLQMSSEESMESLH
jgi:PTS system galactitol-specific IIA component